MNKYKNYLSSNGFTLIELLASITLLSIVIIIFFNIFSNSLSLSQKTEEKLTSTNVAEKVLNTLRRTNEENSIPLGEHRYEDNVNGKTYYSNVNITQQGKETELGIKRVHVQVFSSNNSNSKPDSEIYGYIETGGK
ncbi:prepilin-type N-terminal cleavage/methylation domain-containing protein [Bacillus sp. Bva_UNVM-123]|uniref:type II secretion system protein n=1 Tax=Bacillus sp. Bva_UNVM-123 TaxID=2829798 RepID=UPI00391F61BE